MGRPLPERPAPQEIFDAYIEITRTYSEPTLALLVNMLIDTPHYVVRINEDARLEEAPLLLMTTRMQYRVREPDPPLPETGELEIVERPPFLLVPLVRPEKGTLLDTFTIVDSDGTQVPTMPHNRVRGLLAYTIEALVKMAPRTAAADEDPEKAEIQTHETIGKLVSAVCGAGPIRKQPEPDRIRVQNALASIDQLPVPDEWREKLRKFCAQYVDFYIIVAEVAAPPGNNLILSYSHRVPCESRAGEHANRWRGRAGLSPTTIDVQLNNYAFQVQSYHLQISSDAGQYVFDHHLEELETKQHRTQSDIRKGDFKPYIRVYHLEGRPNAHLYIRRQGTGSADGGPRLKAVVQFREIPPGVLGAATVVAASSTALIAFFALSHLGLNLDPTSATPQLKDQLSATINSDVPALLLALPAFTAALIGSWTDLSRVRRASLTTYAALGCTMLLSLGSALYFVWDANHKLVTEIVWRTFWGGSITTEWVWLILMGLSSTLTLFLVRQWLSESRHYFHVVKGRVDRKLAKK